MKQIITDDVLQEALKSYANKDHTHSIVTQSKDGFMSKEDKIKLDGISEGANKYTHPTHTAKNSGFYKVTIDELGHVIEASAVTKTDITSVIGTTQYAPYNHTHSSYLTSDNWLCASIYKLILTSDSYNSDYVMQLVLPINRNSADDMPDFISVAVFASSNIFSPNTTNAVCIDPYLEANGQILNYTLTGYNITGNAFNIRYEGRSVIVNITIKSSAMNYLRNTSLTFIVQPYYQNG